MRGDGGDDDDDDDDDEEEEEEEEMEIKRRKLMEMGKLRFQNKVKSLAYIEIYCNNGGKLCRKVQKHR